MGDQTVLGLAAAPATTSDPERIVQRLKLETTVKGGGGWFFWIAALSMVNTAIVFSGSHWHFIMGLGITTIVDFVARNLGGVGHAAALVINAFIAGVFILFGVFARRGAQWAFIVGMILYALDGLIFLLAKDLLGLGFHVFALFCMCGGLAAQRKLSALNRVNLVSGGAPIGPS